MAAITPARRRLVTIYGALYKRANVDLSVCAYCGAPRECLDHVPPISIAEEFDTKKYRESGGEFVLYPCCNRCNSWLGKKYLITFNERLVFLYGRYQKEIAKRKAMWSSDEIEELGYNMKKIVMASQAKLKDLISGLRGVEDRLLSLDECDAV